MPIFGFRNLLFQKTKVVLPHIGLTIVTALYIALGALFCVYIERPNEIKSKAEKINKIQRLQENYLENLWDIGFNESYNEEEWRDRAKSGMDPIIEEILSAFVEIQLTEEELWIQNATLDDIQPAWSYPTALFFSTVVMTTIGYGNLVPKTLIGKIFVMAYALFGIPLALVTIADLGKFVAMAIVKAYEKTKMFFQKLYRGLRKRKIIKSHIESNSNTITKPASSVKTSPSLEDEEGRALDELMMDPNELPVPASFILLVLLSYTAFGAAWYVLTEDSWSFTDAFYFCFITMSTIGFGDLVPSQEPAKSFLLLFTIVYIIFGLVLTTMTIDMVGSHYIRKIHFMGRKLNDAKAALALLGDKAANMGDLLGQLKFIQKKYGLSDKQMELLVMESEKMLMVPPGPHGKPSIAVIRAFIPEDAELISWIDRTEDGSTYGMAKLAKMDFRTIDCIPEVHEFR